MTAAEKAARIIEVEAEIAEIDTALSHIRKAGQSYTINSGGSIRTVTLADYDKLKNDRADLKHELASLNGNKAMRVRPGW
jgi:hypothetical protein